MTDTETVEALLKDLTAENQLQLLPILADALSDAGLDRQEQALRYALAHKKRPLLKEEIISKERSGLIDTYGVVYWRPDCWNKEENKWSTLPYKYVRELTHNQGNTLLDGRYYDSVEAAWRSFLVCADKHLELLLTGVRP